MCKSGGFPQGSPFTRRVRMLVCHWEYYPCIARQSGTALSQDVSSFNVNHEHSQVSGGVERENVSDQDGSFDDSNAHAKIRLASGPRTGVVTPGAKVE